MSALLGGLLLVLLLLPSLDVFRRRQSRGSRQELGVLLAMIGIGAALRAIGLGYSSLEHLEVTYLFESIKPDTLWGTLTSRQAAEQMHQPLYDVLIRWWAGASTSEIWIRIPSVILSLATIPMVWTLVRDRGTPMEAALAAGMTTAAPILVWYGRDATPYALLAMTSLTAVASIAQALKRPSRWAHLRTAIALSLAFYTHFHGGWVAITVGGWMLWSARERRRTVLEVTGFTAIFCLPWIPALLGKLFTSVQGLNEDQPLMRYSHALGEAVPEAFRLLFGDGWWALIPLAAAGTALLFKRRSDLGPLVVVAAVIGLIAELHILWQLKTAKGIVYVDVRHYIYLAPLLLAPIAMIPTVRHAAAWLAIASLLGSSITLARLEKPDVRSAAAYLSQYATGPEHAVAYLPAPWYEPLLEYYLLGICPDLVHARSREGWWDLKTCEFHEKPAPGTIYGFPPSPERAHLSTRRRTLKYLWVLDMRDHRFGLPVPPTDPQERYLCWKDAEAALIRSKEFGPWVRLSVYDVERLREIPPPPTAARPATTVTARQAWEFTCPE